MFATLGLLAFLSALLVLAGTGFAVRRLRLRLQRTPRAFPGRGEPLVVGFFHPYCNSGGGGERVLWMAIASMHKLFTIKLKGRVQWRCVVYTGDAAPVRGLT